LEQGKPLAEAKGEVAAAAEIFEWYAEEARRLYGRVIPARGNTQQLVMLQAVGPVAAFTPWNFPALTPARKMAGALAAGCSCIIKPAEETPGTAIELARACVDAGLPAGVLNMVFGVPVQISEFLIRAPQIRKISFTGSIAVGKHLAALAATHGLKRCTMELGGHAPVLVFDDAAVEKAARACATAKFRNAGQVCIAPSRFYVQQGVYQRFLDAFMQITEGLQLGQGLDAATTMGPLANERRVTAMAAFVEDAVDRGGQILTGGKRADRPGFFWQPTILTGLPDTARALTDETFGPLAPIASFETLDEVLQRANGLPYGLSAYAFTSSTATAMAVSARLDAGMVGINSFAVSLAEAPFGGIKESGYGSEGGTEGLGAYLNTKFVAQALA
jgi:succinate-semialdehyde dehydrogenase/glutarate-semialdehyde dehydrogenase